MITFNFEIFLQETCEHIQNLRPVLERFESIGKASNETFAFWLEHCNMSDILLNSLAAERDSNWDLHLETFKEMLTYDRAYDHYKYFTWGTIYLSDMLRLPTEHPDLYEKFQIGCHTVSRNKKVSEFNCVSTDMALEQGMNRDSKTKGGIIGISDNADAVEKLTLSSHIRAAIHSNFKEICCVKSYNSKSSLKKREQNENAVKKIISAIKEKFVNPFQIKENEKTNLVNIATGSVAPPEIKHDILNAKSIGMTSANEYIRKRLINREVPFWDSIKKLNLRTFSSMDKQIKIPRQNEATLILKTQQNLFSRLLSVSSTRHVDMKSVLCHELSAVPLSIFHPNGEMRKTTKSNLLKELESLAESSLELNNNNIDKSASVLDFMAIVQSSNFSDVKTFRDFVIKLKNSITSCFKESRIVAVVPDRYDNLLSIKSEERKRRQKVKCYI